MNRILFTPALLLLVVTASSCQRNAAAEPAAPNVPPNEVWVSDRQVQDAGILTAQVEPRPIGDTLPATGRVTFSDIKVGHVFSPVTGRITNVVAALGQHVAKGDALAVIQSPDVASATSDLQKAEADLSAARRDYERQKELYQAHAAAARDFEAAESAYAKATAERDRAAEKSRIFGGSGRGLQEYVLRAPIDGEVVARTAGLGMEVQGQYSGGTAPELFTIGNTDRVWVLADVFEVDLPRIRVGAPASVTVVAYPDQPFAGTVDWISGTLDPQTRTAKVRCTIDNSRHLLRPEMYATVTISTGGAPKLAVPRSAVVRLGEQNFAFVDRGVAPGGGRRFERRSVTVDDTISGEAIPVTAGLTAGEKVVSSGAVILSGSGA